MMPSRNYLTLPQNERPDCHWHCQAPDSNWRCSCHSNWSWHWQLDHCFGTSA